MRAGRLRKKIFIQNTTSTRDAYGSDVTTWEDFAQNRWASVEPLRGTEGILGRAFQNKVDTRFTIRYIAGLKGNMRILYNQEAYDIESIINVDERNRELQILCSRITT